MGNLSPCTPLEHLLPLTIGALTARENAPRRITAILPFRGKDETLRTALKKAHDLSLPAPGKITQKAGMRLVWAGRDQVLLIGAKPASRTLAPSAALEDQSNAWAVIRLQGEGPANALARLCPVDLRASVFKQNHVVATEFAHIPALITRAPSGVEIMVGRSFVKTAVERLSDARESVAACLEITAPMPDP